MFFMFQESMEKVYKCLRNTKIRLSVWGYGINISNQWLFGVSYQLLSDYRENWLLQYILTRPDFVHRKTSQRESHKHLQFQYNYSTFCLCTLETKLHQRLPVEKRKPFYITIKYAYYVRCFVDYIFSSNTIQENRTAFIYEYRVGHIWN